ncbi:MAG: Bax inhibitor-1/YccA family protein [Actinomycetia bacterium]|nr:Bax inhibitor-1/YccA family protein [Actinomycetes bacterium]
MRTSNPVLTDRALAKASTELGEGPGAPIIVDAGERFTVVGTIQRSAILLVLVIAGGWVGWNLVDVTEFGSVTTPGWLMPSALALVALAFLTFFKPALAPVTAPIWALGEGVLVGAISHVYEFQFDGIVVQAAIATVATAGATLLAYQSGLIRATPQFRKIVSIATMGVMAVYLINMAMMIFGGDGITLLWDSGPLGIGISLFVVGLAAMNLVLDFDLFERGEAAGWPPKMMWFAAFGLVVTLVWLYLELLRLLAKLRD